MIALVSVCPDSYCVVNFVTILIESRRITKYLKVHNEHYVVK
jgi:hypothetical protein